MSLFKPNVEKMKAKEDVKGLLKALKDKDHYVRRKVVDALGEIGDARALESLFRATKDKDWGDQEREGAERVVEKIKSKKS